MFYKVNGNAGSGKTHTMIKQIEQLWLDNTDFIVITPTNKAAQVLNSRLVLRGLPKLVRTLHSTIYTWTPGDVKEVRQVRRIDPLTSKYEVDKAGNPVYHEETEYYWVKELSNNLYGKIILVDESSMVGCDVWYDLLNCDEIKEIWAYGDEKQLPPIEDLDKLDDNLKPYYRFWHNYTDENSKTLPGNYRQEGSLKTFVDTIQDSLFNKRGAQIPTPLAIGNNFAVHASTISETDLLEIMVHSDIIITPYKKVRELSNIICRTVNFKKLDKKYNKLPIIGDKIIFVDSIKRTVDKRKKVFLAKNTMAVVDWVYDIDLHDGLAIIDFTDEDGTEHKKESVSLSHILGERFNNDCARIDYAYAVTAHSSQGGQWPNVLFLDSYWKEDAEKLRYVAITRASEHLSVVSGITNTTEAKDADKSILIRLAKMLQQ